jgi:hypothetical protein
MIRGDLFQRKKEPGFDFSFNGNFLSKKFFPVKLGFFFTKNDKLIRNLNLSRKTEANQRRKKLKKWL